MAAKIIGLIVGLGLSFVVWDIGRRINYRFSYKAMVENTVRSMVRTDALREIK